MSCSLFLILSSCLHLEEVFFSPRRLSPCLGVSETLHGPFPPANSAEALLLLRACSQPNARVSPRTAISVKTQKIKCNQAHYKGEAVMRLDLPGPASLTLSFFVLGGLVSLHIETSLFLFFSVTDGLSWLGKCPGFLRPLLNPFSPHSLHLSSGKRDLVKQILLLRSYFTYRHSSRGMRFPTGLMFPRRCGHTTHLKLLLGCIFGFSVCGMGAPRAPAFLMLLLVGRPHSE